MSVSTSITQTARHRRSTHLVATAVLAVIIAVAAWAIVTYAAGHGTHTTKYGALTQAAVVSGLTPQEQQYVAGIAALSPAQLQAAFGTVQPSGDSPWTRSLTPRERRYVQAIASMSSSESAAAFGAGK